MACRVKIAFYKGHPGTAYELAIRLGTNGPYSHAALVYADGLLFEAAPGKRTGYAPYNYDARLWDEVIVPMEEVQQRAVWMFCNSEQGCEYDYPGVFRFAIPFVQQSKERWFCSEVCLAALQQTGLFPGIKPWLYHPNRLYRLLTT